MMNKDEIEGKAEQIKGRVKQGVAEVTGDPELHDEGRADEDAGVVRENFGTAKRKVGEAIENIGKHVKK